MTKTVFKLSFIFFLISFGIIAQVHYDLLIKNANITDVEKGKIIADQHVIINAGKIIRIDAKLKKGDSYTTIIDGKGKYLIPGLWDMHTHNWWKIHFSSMYVANGVLGVRNMYTPMSMIKPVTDSIEKNLLNGPKYFAAGRVLEGNEPEFPDWIVVDSLSKIKPALDSLQKEGSDFVKVYNKIPRAVYFDLVKEAHKRKMEVEGHVPMEVGALEASAAGQKSFEHLLGIPELCTRDTLFKNRHGNNWFATVMQEPDYATMKIDEQLALKNFSVLKKNKTYICPTLVVWYSYFHPDTLFENNPVLKNLPEDMTDFWKAEIEKYRKKDASYKTQAIKKYEVLKRVTYLLYQSGVPMLTGTDAINPYCYPGYSLHKEFELLKECGIPDAAILQMATANAADFFNLKGYGRIKAGCNASLVLLNKNPLENIRNTTDISKVILNGRAMDK